MKNSKARAIQIRKQIRIHTIIESDYNRPQKRNRSESNQNPQNTDECTTTEQKLNPSQQIKNNAVTTHLCSQDYRECNLEGNVSEFFIGALKSKHQLPMKSIPYTMINAIMTDIGNKKRWIYVKCSFLGTVGAVVHSVYTNNNYWYYILCDSELLRIQSDYATNPVGARILFSSNELEKEDNELWKSTYYMAEFEFSNNESKRIDKDVVDQHNDHHSDSFKQKREQCESSTVATNNNIIIDPWKKRLQVAMETFLTKDEMRRVKSKHITEYGIYFYLWELGFRFYKITVVYNQVEAVNIMRKLAQRQLEHRNLIKVIRYEVMYQGKEKMITATKIQVYHVYKAFIQKRYFVKNNSSLLEWLWKDVIMAILDGLEYLHKNEIIHGDISSGNILFAKENGHYYAVISDLNSSIPFSLLNNEEELKKRLSVGCGSMGYYPVKERPSEYTDCYGFICVICRFIWYGLFGTIDDYYSEEYEEEYEKIFDVEEWKHVIPQNQFTILQQFITSIHMIYDKIVLPKQKDISVLSLKKHFRDLHPLFEKQKEAEHN